MRLQHNNHACSSVHNVYQALWSSCKLEPMPRDAKMYEGPGAPAGSDSREPGCIFTEIFKHYRVASRSFPCADECGVKGCWSLLGLFFTLFNPVMALPPAPSRCGVVTSYTESVRLQLTVLDKMVHGSKNFVYQNHPRFYSCISRLNCKPSTRGHVHSKSANLRPDLMF